MSAPSSKRKSEKVAETKILFATDLHGSETFFYKILSVAKNFKVNILIISGDLTGKAIVPIVEVEKGRYFTTFFGRDYRIGKQNFLNSKITFGRLATTIFSAAARSMRSSRLNGAYLAKLCANDWGIYKTFTTVIGKTQIMLHSFDLSDQEKQTVRDRLKRISDLIEAEPKSMSWKMRARVGEKAAWYKLPDEMGE